MPPPLFLSLSLAKNASRSKGFLKLVMKLLLLLPASPSSFLVAAAPPPAAPLMTLPIPVATRPRTIPRMRSRTESVLLSSSALLISVVVDSVVMPRWVESSVTLE